MHSHESLLVCHVLVFVLQVFNELFVQVMTEDRVFEMVSKAQEFDQIKVCLLKLISMIRPTLVPQI